MPLSLTGPIVVSNIRLKSRASVRSQFGPWPGGLLGFCGQLAFSRSSARKRCLQTRQSTIGSEKPPTWPEASHTRGCSISAESSATMSSRSCTIARSQAALTLPFMSTP